MRHHRTIPSYLAFFAGCLAATAPALAAQEPLFRSAIVPISALSVAHRLASGDLDGDGHVDLVAGGTDSSGKGLVVVALSDGAGTWEAQPALEVEPWMTTFTLGDLNGDHLADLAYALAAPGMPEGILAVRLADGDGGFGAPGFHATVVGPTDVALADLDGDGLLDAAVPGQWSHRLSFLRGLGDGTFAPGVDYAAGDQPVRVVVGDWNGDGAPDLAVTNHTPDPALGGFSVLLNKVHGGFGAPTYVPMDIGNARPGVGDLDGNGTLDLVMLQLGFETATTFALLHGKGDGSFASPVLLDAPKGAGSGFESLAVADWNEDGAADLACVAGSNVALRFADGAGGFLPPQFVGLDAFGNSQALLADDVTGDGDPDLLAGAQSPDFQIATVRVFEGDGAGGFLSFPTVSGVGSAESAGVGDLDGDGRSELVISSASGAMLPVLRGGPGGSFGAGPALPLEGLIPPGAGVTSVTIADIDGDGHPDVAATIFAMALIFHGDGALGFTPPLVLPLTGISYPTALFAADLDGDGLKELLGLTVQQHKVLVLHNLGQRTFAPPALLDTHYFPLAFAVDDMNGDALPDIVVVTRQTTAPWIQVFLNHGDGTFSALDLPLPFVPGGLALGDIDDDGDVDALVTDVKSADVTTFTNDGSGVLAAGSLLYMKAAELRGITFADLDGDGLQDIAAGARDTVPKSAHGTVSVRRGLGGGAFAEPELTTTLPSPALVIAHDVDGDGALDLVAGPTVAGAVSVLLNQTGPWNNLGHALAGGLGLPELTGEGPLAELTPFHITLTDTKPDGFVLLMMGFVANSTPFHGGVLVPVPRIVWRLAVDGEGGLVLEDTVPAGAAGLTLYGQAWFPDSAGPEGWAASNALSAALH